VLRSRREIDQRSQAGGIGPASIGLVERSRRDRTRLNGSEARETEFLDLHVGAGQAKLAEHQGKRGVAFGSEAADCATVPPLRSSGDLTRRACQKAQSERRC